MKQTPQDKKIEDRMQPGNLTLHGFLGSDERTISDIIQEDEKTLSKLGKTPEEIAERMKFFTGKAFENYDRSVKIDNKYQVEMESVRGKLPCPFGHPHAYEKGEVTFTNLAEKITVRWTPINIHLIESHHFFEGKGSEHRLDPEILVRILF